MTQDQDQPKTGMVRLPELPVFQKYSIALRQEWESADEFAQVLRKTLIRVRQKAGPGSVPTSAIGEETETDFWETDPPRKSRAKGTKKSSRKRGKPDVSIVRVSSRGTPLNDAQQD